MLRNTQTEAEVILKSAVDTLKEAEVRLKGAVNLTGTGSLFGSDTQTKAVYRGSA